MLERYPRWAREAIRRQALDQNTVSPGGAYTGRAIRPAPFYEPYGVSFVWDLCYSGYAIARVGAGPAVAKEALGQHLRFAVAEGPDAGMLPRSVTRSGDQAGQDGSQCMLLSWLALHLHRLAPDPGWVGAVYPALAASLDWWQSPRRDVDADGLSEYAGSTPTYVAYESGHDFSPERDLVMAEPHPVSADGLVHEPIADLFLNCCLYVELGALAELADLVDPGRAAQWRARAQRLAAAISQRCWDEEVGAFFPVLRRDLCPEQPRYIRHTPAMLMPLWAGIATAEQAARTVSVLRSDPRDYPYRDATMRVELDARWWQGYRIVTDGLMPTRGPGRASGGVERADGSVRLWFGADRGPNAAAFRSLAIAARTEPGTDDPIEVAFVDGRDQRRATRRRPDADGWVRWDLGPDPFQSSTDPRPTWIAGLRGITVRGPVREIVVDYSRTERSGLLSRFGLKSAHPLDGKHPAPGAPTEFWSGTVWGPHQLHACAALRRYGYDDLARSIAMAYCDTIVAALASGGGVFEHNSHENGAGLGVRDYTWGGGVALVLMADYLDHLPTP